MPLLRPCLQLQARELELRSLLPAGVVDPDAVREEGRLAHHPHGGLVRRVPGLGGCWCVLAKSVLLLLLGRMGRGGEGNSWTGSSAVVRECEL